MGSAWIAPEGEGMDSFPEGWKELGFIEMDGYCAVDPAGGTEWIVSNPLPTSYSWTIPLSPEFAQLFKELFLGEWKDDSEHHQIRHAA